MNPLGKDDHKATTRYNIRQVKSSSSLSPTVDQMNSVGINLYLVTRCDSAYSLNLALIQTKHRTADLNFAP